MLQFHALSVASGRGGGEDPTCLICEAGGELLESRFTNPPALEEIVGENAK